MQKQAKPAATPLARAILLAKKNRLAVFIYPDCFKVSRVVHDGVYSRHVYCGKRKSPHALLKFVEQLSAVAKVERV